MRTSRRRVLLLSWASVQIFVKAFCLLVYSLKHTLHIFHLLACKYYQSNQSSVMAVSSIFFLLCVCFAVCLRSAETHFPNSLSLLIAVSSPLHTTLDSEFLHDFIQAFSSVILFETHLHGAAHGISESSRSVSIVNRLRSTRSENQGSIPGECGDFSLRHNIQTDSGTHPVSCMMGTSG
jgi:hypothetical protein